MGDINTDLIQSAIDIGLSRKPDDPSGLRLDIARYEPLLADLSISDAEKRELLEALWSIVIAFVDLGFNVHPLQLVSAPPCGQNAERARALPPSVIESEGNSTSSTGKGGLT